MDEQQQQQEQHQQSSNNNNNNDLLQTVEDLVEELRRTIIVVEEFQNQSQPLLFERLNKIIGYYGKIESQKKQFDRAEIPLEIFNVIDQSKNPDLYVKETLQNCINANERSKGKIESIRIILLLTIIVSLTPKKKKTFKDELDAHIKDTFSEEYNIFKQQQQQQQQQQIVETND
ncbi:putative mediator complex subunit 10 [Cavenderia fasciculata]|uniref:Mediator of RNA polymerase II transcription subunit 10 n=1 Tax=Cavenderia fasciculata TaxID=261658 RepID=F4PR62_CACFS|nr:putative mediator complex subunit 10 [Cavenderia fasciculata]EGG20473.1 putative mediator complex subunit 10 [Cavenderia fasciculata]|eukprot:XP_004358323.1 putative mediator complex subunit 10 [Cavenderia fasciculata]